MNPDSDKKYRKIQRNFKEKIDLMNKLPQDVSIRIFFEMCDFFLNNYIKTEKERFPNKTIREILINMYKTHEKMSGRKINKWK